MVRELNGFNIM